ncbi:MAG TPA: hypothetical protein VLF95_06075 [Vicinamibacteria bacterium]|nr:hypothetical protein [Vicinamibacteria bacterium]
MDLSLHRQVRAVGPHDARLPEVDRELRDEGRLAVAQVDLDVVQHLHGHEGLAGEVGGTHGVAPAALGAGVGVEEALPRQLLHAVDPELLGLLEVDPRRQAVALATVEPGVRPREHQVHVLGRRQVGGEAEEDQHVRPPAGGPHALDGGRGQRGDGPRHEGAERLEGRRPAAHPLPQEDRRPHEDEERGVEREDEPEDPLAVLRAREQARRVAGEAPDEGDGRRDEDRGGEEVLAEVIGGGEEGRQEAVVGERPPAEGPPEGGQPFEDDLEVADAQDEESVEEDAVQEPGRRVLLQPALPERVGEHGPGPLDGPVGQDLVAAGPGVDEDSDPEQPPGHEGERRHEEGERDEGLQNRQDHGEGTSDVAKSTP